jgi:hypothetical protein
MSDGGPVFPVESRPFHGWGNDTIVTHTGLSLRDYFATHALQGLIANPSNTDSEEMFARAAYSIADAMLKERTK